MRSRELTAIAIGLPALFASATMAKEARKPVPLPLTGEWMVILKLPDGTLMGNLMQTVDGVQEAVARYSRDNGLTWSDPETLFQLPQEGGDWGGPEALVDRDGEVHLFLLKYADANMPAADEEKDLPHGYLGGYAGQRLDLWHVKSQNGRRDWTPPRMVWKGYTGALNSVLQMANGRILLPFSHFTARTWGQRGPGLDAFTFTGQFDSTLIYSDDAGDTWGLANSLSVPVPDIVSAYGAVEPVVLQLQDGRVWMLIRTQQGRFYESFSPDGAAWSPPQPTSILSSDSPAGLVRLEDGRIVLFWNNCLRFPYAYGGRHVLHAAISEDEGKTWRGYREVARDPRRHEPPPPGGDFGTAYPFPTVVNGGKVIYCTGQGAGRVLLMLLDPDWLLETSQKADFSDGAEEWATFGTQGVEFVAHPEKPGAKVLSLRKTDPDWPAAAVWNFPSGRQGRLHLRLKLNPGFAGALVGLTDHFSVPFDLEDRFNNLFNLDLGVRSGPVRASAVRSEPVRTSASRRNYEQGARLTPGRWHDLLLEWDCAGRECRVLVDGRSTGVLPLLRETAGVCYLRLRSTAEQTDNAGFLVESVEADISNN